MVIITRTIQTIHNHGNLLAMFLREDIIQQCSLSGTKIPYFQLACFFPFYFIIPDSGGIPVTSVIGTRFCAGVSSVVVGVEEMGCSETSTSSGGASSSSMSAILLVFYAIQIR